MTGLQNRHVSSGEWGTIHGHGITHILVLDNKNILTWERGNKSYYTDDETSRVRRTAPPGESLNGRSCKSGVFRAGRGVQAASHIRGYCIILVSRSLGENTDRLTLLILYVGHNQSPTSRDLQYIGTGRRSKSIVDGYDEGSTSCLQK